MQQLLTNVTYYGKTESHPNIRSSEHTGISHLTEKSVECKPSAVSDHLLLHNHGSDFIDFTILSQDNNDRPFHKRHAIAHARANKHAKNV